MNQAEFDVYIQGKNDEIKELQGLISQFLKQLPQSLAQERLLLLYQSIVMLQNQGQQSRQDAFLIFQQVAERINSSRTFSLDQKKGQMERADDRLKQSLKWTDDFFAGQIAERKKDIIALKIKYQL